MNVKSVELLALTRQQLEAHQRLSQLTSRIEQLAKSQSIEVIASLPMLDSDLQKLVRFNKAISIRLHGYCP